MGCTGGVGYTRASGGVTDVNRAHKGGYSEVQGPVGLQGIGEYSGVQGSTDGTLSEYKNTQRGEQEGGCISGCVRQRGAGCTYCIGDNRDLSVGDWCAQWFVLLA